MGPGRRAAVARSRKERTVAQPNIVFLHLDQMHHGCIGAYGAHAQLETPHIDRLAEESLSFMGSHATMPQCVPARTSWMTGRMSKEHGSVQNFFMLDPALPDLGQWMRDRGGYETVHAGKWHVNGRDVERSFKVLTHGHGMAEFGDAHVARTASAFLADYRGDRPFFLSIGLVNPHDCCFAAGAYGGRTGHAGQLPPHGMGLSPRALPRGSAWHPAVRHVRGRGLGAAIRGMSPRPTRAASLLSKV
jgi:hypothetical protein